MAKATFLLAFASAHEAMGAGGGDEPHWPEQRGNVITLSSALGWCKRTDAVLATEGVCGEFLALGIDFWPLPHVPRQFRLTVEVGGGFTPGVTIGDSTFGYLRQSTGGAYGALRTLFGWDVTELFFLRLGPDLNVTQAVTLGGVFEIGTRTLNHVEVGARLRWALDGVTHTGSPAHPNAELTNLTFDIGPLFFVRVFL